MRSPASSAVARLRHGGEAARLMAAYSRQMHPALLTSEAGDVRRGSGTAVAAANLVEAFMLNGVPLAVFRGRDHPLGHGVARARFNRAAWCAPSLYDALLGIGGDGQAMASRGGIPFVSLPKALYGRVLAHERGLTRRLLRGHAALELRSSVAASLVVVPSRFAAGVVHADFGVPWSRIEVIPEPFPAARWQSAAPAAAREGRRVLVVAHLYRRKRVRDVISAWPVVRRDHRDAVLDIAGDGPEHASLRRVAARVDGVRILGHVAPDRLRGLYAKADVLVSASAHETFGYAVVEGLAAGLPVVAAAAPAVVEVCEGAVAEHVAIGDVAALASAISASLEPGVARAAAALNPALTARFESVTVGAAYLEALAVLVA
jgi:glycosyltransferase involved in cell wall biosynthesis